MACTGPMIVVAKDGVDPQGCLQLGQDRPNSVYLLIVISMVNKISGAYNHIFFRAVGLIDDITDKGLRDQTVVKVSKMNYGETAELWGKVRNRNPVSVHLNPITLSEQLSEQRHDSKSSS